MAYELEIKYWIWAPRSVQLALEPKYLLAEERKGIEQVVDSLMERAAKISKSKIIEHHFLDQYMERGNSRKRLKIEKSLNELVLDGAGKNSCLRFKESKLNILSSNGDSIKAQYGGMKKLLDENSLASKEEVKAYDIRVREDMENHRTYLTIKKKIRSQTIAKCAREYEFEVESKDAAILFFESLGYSLNPLKSKVKIQKKFKFNHGKYLAQIEINESPELGGSKFLELEIVSDRPISGGASILYGIARKLGIEKVYLAEQRGYKKLHNELMANA